MRFDEILKDAPGKRYGHLMKCDDIIGGVINIVYIGYACCVTPHS